MVTSPNWIVICIRVFLPKFGAATGRKTMTMKVLIPINAVPFAKGTKNETQIAISGVLTAVFMSSQVFWDT